MGLSTRFAICFIALSLTLTLFYALGFNFSTFSFEQVDLNSILESPSTKHLFGTDALGRDLFTRIIHGGQMSLSIAFLTAFNALLIGLVFGISSAYIGKMWDELVMRSIDIIYSLPDLLVLSIIALFVSRSTSGIIIGLAFINWMDLARIIRVEIMRLKSEEFILASRITGMGDLEIIFKHLLPNTMGPLIATLSFTIPRAILAESTLSFIGLGLSPPDTSWGSLAGSAWQYLRTDPHMIFFPALMIFLTVYSFNTLGDFLIQYNKSYAKI
jgi:oligopeptide transport system permease protein